MASSPTQTSPTPLSSGAPLPGNAPSSPNSRFGLSLGSLIRRPRGNTNPVGRGFSGGPPSPGSPVPHDPPSPAAEERNNDRPTYFPGLRRKASRKFFGGNNEREENGAAAPGGSSSLQPSSSARSSSQPPVPPLGANDDGSVERSRNRSPAQGPRRSNTTHALTRQDSRSLPPTPRTADQPASPLPPANNSQTHNGDNPNGEASSNGRYHIRLVPHLESTRSLHFEPVERALQVNGVVKIGRFTERTSHPGSQNGLAADNITSSRIAFKSKVVSRSHAEIRVVAERSGSTVFQIKDTCSSSGTFLNHIRLSGPGIESRPFTLRDSDVVQLGVDYQGGTEEIYRCVKMKVEIGRTPQRGPNEFNLSALKQLRALSGGNINTGKEAELAKDKSKASVTDCCICLYPVTVCQALFIAPCSHTTHFKCIRPLIDLHYPGFCCPLCRSFADLNADVEVDIPPPSTDISVNPATPEGDRDLGMNGTAVASTRQNPQGDGSTVEPSATIVAPLTSEPRSDTHPFGSASSDGLDASTTPPNITFLSTLADRPSTSAQHPPISQVPPVSLQSAVDLIQDAPPSGQRISSPSGTWAGIASDESESGPGTGYGSTEGEDDHNRNKSHPPETEHVEIVN